MTDNQQQIHELDMALREIVTNNFVKVPSYSKFGGYLCDTDISTTSIATALCNKHYYKVPEGSIVVDKEYLKTELQGLELQTRKETAKELITQFLVMLARVVLNVEEDTIGANQMTNAAYFFLQDKLKELAKQLGVEVEE